MPDQRILIFGGTFDPPHRAHVELPQLVASSLNCDRILYIPASINPLKADHPPTSAPHRLAMLRLALAGQSNVDISTIELDRDGPSYTVVTLETLAAELGPGVELRLLIGADQAVSFHQWKDWERILSLATPAVMLRPPWNRAAFQAELEAEYDADEAGRWMAWTVDLPILDVNATAMRENLASGRDLDGDLDAGVLAYIRSHGLYGAAGD